MDQILSNFIPYSNPYVILSWPVPAAFSSTLKEIRSEVLWSGTINLTYPDELQPNQPARVAADTSFTIKGWMFPAHKPGDDAISNILYANTNLTPVTGFQYI